MLTILLCLGFMVTALVNYMTARNLIRQSIIDSELPLTSDNIYSEIQKDLVRPVFVSSMMAGDTFLRDWMLGGETDVSKISRYLAEIKQRYGAHTSFLVSDRTRNYYQAEGLLKQVSPKAERDVWYYRVRGMKEPYEINVDPDMANKDELTIFVNYRVLDFQGNYLGATGVGLAVDSVSDLINEYQARYRRIIYFVEPGGRLMLFAGAHPLGSNVREVVGLRDLIGAIFESKDGGTYEYTAAGGENHLLNVRYIPELHWYLFVEKREDEALSGIRRSLYLNLVISVAVTGLVLLLVSVATKRYQDKLETVALSDKLTGLANRQALDLILLRDMAEHKRTGMGLAILLLDLDRFKEINDEHGHLAGDEVLRRVAVEIRSQLRDSDMVGRWGGEEFLVILKRSDLNAAHLVAEKIRQHLASTTIGYARAQIGLGCSIGVAVLRDDDTQDSLLNRADRGLYTAKQSGRNRVCDGE
ncbi:MAG TPA: sensor domain-containing diguanylate cyclase [Rhodocyclaceae bacterium]|nr:sensor domain-containing diguanylate cyclase [Rhodocyclaceae bacterium]